MEITNRVARLRRTLLIIILVTLPCYLLGTIVLFVARSASSQLTVTPTNNILVITATQVPTSTNPPPTGYPTPTATATATATPTFTVTFTVTPTPTHTPTDLPTFTFTATDLPTDTPTLPPTIAPTLEPTLPPTDTLAP